MIEHIILMRWNEQASPGAITLAMAELQKLKDKIPGIVDMTAGVNFSARSQGYTHGAVMRFTDRAALDAYYPHPEHQRVVQNFINPIRAEALAFDYEF